MFLDYNHNFERFKVRVDTETSPSEFGEFLCKVHPRIIYELEFILGEHCGSNVENLINAVKGMLETFNVFFDFEGEFTNEELKIAFLKDAANVTC